MSDNETNEYIKFLLKHFKESKLKNKTPNELKEMCLKKQLGDILEKKGINIKRKSYSELKSEYNKYINDVYIASKTTDSQDSVELYKDITNKLWLELLE